MVTAKRLLDWEGWGMAQEGFDAATLYAYVLLQPDTAGRARTAFPVLGSPAGLAAEATVCAQLLQTVAAETTWSSKDRFGTGLGNSAAAEPACSP
ncbi:hypothetical protein [Streptomyces werraensis]|uniref:hypothetical protein n=1 Tax=Streptomyces werraensis TaxID=68284 RepID=UPI0036F4E8DE